MMSRIYREIDQLPLLAMYAMRFLKYSWLSAFLYFMPGFLFAQTVHPNIDLVLIEKAKRKMYLISNGETYREFYISLGNNPIGHKQQEGDDKTPEGRYLIDYRNENSRFHLSLHITYPSSKDVARAKQQGVDPGGDIFIHGVPNGMEKKEAAFYYRDWTDGCIGVLNSEIKEIWELVEIGTVIEIRP